MKMNPQVKKLWTGRLRALPNHRQGKGSLRRHNKMCCLGVLCEIAVEHGVVKRSPKDPNGDFAYGKHGHSGTLPPEVIEWAGLPLGNDSPRVKGIRLASMNDAYDHDPTHKNFDEIADLIDEHL